MSRCVAMLRGINVGGHRKIKMAELREVFVELGYADATTYIQSGNVLFTNDVARPNDVAERVHTALAERYGFDVAIILRTADQLRAVIADNPFFSEGCDIKPLYVTFVDVPTDGLGASPHLPDDFAAADGRVYVHVPGGYGTTKLTNQWFERKLGARATTRNWRTVTTLLGKLTS